eukprot:GHVO01010409.1.p1 GENE.GHVO01010409.1~~GHVO01010409.1.p1  ORF type:complete len:180 (+),score=20.02 GHVO01010409.1:98-637(+)
MHMVGDKNARISFEALYTYTFPSEGSENEHTVGAIDSSHVYRDELTDVLLKNNEMRQRAAGHCKIRSRTRHSRRLSSARHVISPLTLAQGHPCADELVKALSQRRNKTENTEIIYSPGGVLRKKQKQKHCATRISAVRKEVTSESGSMRTMPFTPPSLLNELSEKIKSKGLGPFGTSKT